MSRRVFSSPLCRGCVSSAAVAGLSIAPIHPDPNPTQQFYNEAEARDVCLTLLEAMKYCHDQGIVHRDLKPENLLLADPQDDSSIRIADFGFAVSVLNGYVTDQCGTPGYVAPEILRAKAYGTVSDER